MKNWRRRLALLRKMACLLLVLYGTMVHGANGAYAQKKSGQQKADSYFENREFAKAIPLYKREADSNNEALRRLADCYRMIKNYPAAQDQYAKLVQREEVSADVYYYYGEALLSNGNYQEARKQFVKFNELQPNEPKGELYIKACDQLSELMGKPSLYKVYNLGDVNSEVSDFSPVFYKQGIIFASERVRDLVNYSSNSTTGNPYLSLVYSKYEKPGKKKDTANAEKDTLIFNDADLFAERFSGDGHYGPATFNKDYSEMVFTKVVNAGTIRKGVISRPQLFRTRKGSGWKSPKPLPFNQPEYIMAHPALSPDGQLLYFVSDMPGGHGGTDIWVAKKDGDTWGNPENLGPVVNTKGNETFPYVKANNALYFSSNGHPGFGGLDIFVALQKDGKWSSVSNLMLPVNSFSDDFGIMFKGDNSGFFSSNRPGGKGSDDLYGFALSGQITSLAGKILLSEKLDDGAPNVKVFLVTDNGTIIQTTSTDASGSFLFENLLSDQSYMLRVDENDPELVNQKKVYLADANDKIVKVIVKGGDNYFVFENIPPDLSKMSQLELEDVELKKISIAGNLYSGNQRRPVENTKVNLLNDKGEIVQTTTTNAFGSFVFMNINPDENFTVTLDAADAALLKEKIYFTNKSGTEISAGNGASFRFQILASDSTTLSMLKVEDSQLLVNLTGVLYGDKEGKTRIGKTRIKLVDDKGGFVDSSLTDAAGKFKFSNLAPDKNYMVRLNEDDPILAAKDVYLANSSGEIVAVLKSADGKFFRFSILPSEEKSLANIYFEDPWLKVAKAKSDAYADSVTMIIENVYYDYEKWNILPQALITLDKVVSAMKSNPDMKVEIFANTDARGSDEYNLKLSQKRADAAVSYIISKGISKARLKATGMGETNLVNKCGNDVECSDEEHAQNRRTEFKVVKSKAE